MRFRRSRRRAFAAILALAWLVGLELLPALHLAAHDDDHTHAAGGTIVRVTFGGHRHADGTYHGGHAAEVEVPAPPPKRRLDQLAFRAPDAAHDASGVAHHAAASSSAPPPLLAPRPVERTTLAVASLADELRTHLFARPHARGPPA